MTPESFYRKVMEKTHLGSREGAKLATAAVFHALRDRLTPEEADQALAQLPSELKRVWGEGEQAERRPVKLRRQQFYERVKQDGELPSVRDARGATLGVFGALKEQLSPGEAEDILSQLPKDLKEVWMEA